MSCSSITTPKMKVCFFGLLFFVPLVVGQCPQSCNYGDCQNETCVCWEGFSGNCTQFSYAECEQDPFLANDTDNDGIIDVLDNCPNHSDPSLLDTDRDTIGDKCDNCPLIPNTNQKDTDSDGVGDFCDDCPNDFNPTQRGECVDIDGDGWNGFEGDCSETTTQCPAPRKTNPGAFEVLNDGIDNDCDNNTLDTVSAAPCSFQPKFSGFSYADIAQAIDLCQFTTANPPKSSKKWGVIGGYLSDIVGTMNNFNEVQLGVLTRYGSLADTPRFGATMVRKKIVILTHQGCY